VAALTQALTGDTGQSGFSALRDDRQGARRPTRFQIAWNDMSLYVLAVCPLEGGPAFRADTHDHDGELWRDDAVEVFVQPAGSEVYFHFGWNAAGTTAEERVQDRSWNPAWYLVTEVTGTAWTSLAVIPFACLGAAPSPETAWRLNVCRSDAANAEFSSWSFSGGGFHRPERFGWLLFAATPPGAAPGLAPGVIEQVASQFFDPPAVDTRRAQIAMVLCQPAGTARLLGLHRQLAEQDGALERAQQRRAALDASSLAGFIAEAGTVPEVCVQVDDALARWRIEHLLSTYETAGSGRR